MVFGKLKKALQSATPENSKKSESAAKTIQTRAARVSVLPEHGIELTLHLESEGGDKTFSISNLSVTGVGVISAGHDISKLIGKTIRGTFTLLKQQSPVELHLVHQTQGLLGARWISMDPAFKKTLWDFLAPEKAAAETTRMREEMLQAPPDGKPVSYQGTAGNEFYGVHRDGKLVRFHLSLFGTRLEWTEGKPAGLFTTGRKMGESRMGESTHELIKLETSSEDFKKLLGQCERFIRALPRLEKSLLDSALSALHS